MKVKLSKLYRYIAIILVFILLISLVFIFSIQQEKNKKQEANTILNIFEETLMLKLNDKYNYTNELSIMAGTKGNVDFVAEQIIKRPECVYIAFLEGEKVSKVYSNKKSMQKYVGTNIEKLDYAYTLAKLTKNFVVEGPVVQGNNNLILTIQPFYKDGLFVGEVAVALDAYVIFDSCNFEVFTQNGYAYELWRVNSINGRKETIAKSSELVNFSRAVEVKFKMPTIWTISLIPENGWYDKNLTIAFLAGAIIITVGFAVLLHFYTNKKSLKNTVLLFGKTDIETGYFTRKSILNELNKWTSSSNEQFFVLYIVINNYNYISQLYTEEEKKKVILHITNCLNQYTESEKHIARIGECNFIMAVRENFTEMEIDNFKKGLSIELLYNATFNGEKVFLTAECESCQFPKDGTSPEKLLNTVIQNYYIRMQKQNPARELAEKCDQIINGDENVLFGEYADIEMNRLSKALTRYKRKTKLK